jgi:hypothetical protein
MRLRGLCRLSIVLVLFLAGSSTPAPGTGIFDAASKACAVSYEGIVWYRVPAGAFSPLDVRRERCPSGELSQGPPPVPGWARPRKPAKALFVATSLQEAYRQEGMPDLERVAQAHRVPITWLVGSITYLTSAAAFYNAYHASNGDDIEAMPDDFLVWTARSLFPWYVPAVSVEGAGRERFRKSSSSAFWGIAWNSRSVDGTADYGAPWGTYCADRASYKRPDPSGACGLLAFEWTARDLTRAYLSRHEEYFSSDPDDLHNAGFDTPSARKYVREMIDAYAAASETQPLVVVSQQETYETRYDGDDAIMDALYGQAVADGMRATTLKRAASEARAFSAKPRAVAFPFLAGGREIPSPLLGDSVVYPATIDYHDASVGMTFLAGHLLPTRVFRYAEYLKSAFNVPMPELSPMRTPTLDGTVIGKGKIVLRFQAPVALRYGIALWSNPHDLRLFGAGVTPAGRAGAVVAFDLRAGVNEIVIPCGACLGDVLSYST